MNIEILNNIATVINVLNGIETKGKNNLISLGGCIATLEEVCQKVQKQITDEANANKDKK